MGTTCTSLHLLRPAGGGGDIARDLKAAYAKIGYTAAKRGEAATKQVIVADDGQGPFLSVHDSDSALIDTGDLKEVAVALTKRLKTTALLTSVQDSDSFELVVFHNGKQVDAVVSDPEGHAGGLAMLSAKRRKPLWADWFLAPQIQLIALGGLAGALGADPLAALLERQGAFEARLKHAATVESAFAEEALAAWCEAAGLPLAKALVTFADLAEASAAESVARLSFGARAARAGDAAPGDTGAKAAVRLATLLDDDHCPYQRVHPAAWPVTPGGAERVQWLALSSGAALSGLRIALDIDDVAAVRLKAVEVAAYPFYNGQMTSATPIARFQLAAPAMQASPWRIEVTPFDLPALDPQTRRQIVIVMVLELAMTGDGAVAIRPTLTPLSPASDPLPLPPIRLQPRAVAWTPRVAGPVHADRTSDMLRLNEPAVLSMAALLDDDGAAVRASVRGWVEAWLETLHAPEGTTLVVHTQKHMSASFRVSKADRTWPLPAPTTDRLWARLFDAEADLQTVMLGIVPPGAAHPVAGVTLQAALRDDARDAEAAAAHIRETIAQYLPPALPEAGPLSRSNGHALAFAPWIVNDAAVFRQLGTSAEAITASFTAWADAVAPIQGWITRAAWIPEFDLYEEYNQTLYERCSPLDWFRSGLNGMLASRAWLSGRLRFVAPVMWLCPELVAAIDIEHLREIADMTPAGHALRVTLREGRSLEKLEAVLWRVLPAREGWPDPDVPPTPYRSIEVR